MTFFSHVFEKLGELLRYPMGWAAGFGLFIVDALTGGFAIIYVVVLATLIDLACGIAVSVKRKSFAKSELLRLTVEKLVVYGLALLVFLCLDKVIADNTSLDVALTSGVVGAVIALTETWSFLASLLILYPSNPFLRMFQKALVGEIARKLQCEEEDVSGVLVDSIKKNKTGKKPAKHKPQ